MFSWPDTVDIVIRITIALACGWPLLWFLKSHNPRWSIAVIRAMVVTAIALPLVYGLAPTFRVAVLPPRARMPDGPPTMNKSNEPSTSVQIEQLDSTSESDEDDGRLVASIAPSSSEISPMRTPANEPTESTNAEIQSPAAAPPTPASSVPNTRPSSTSTRIFWRHTVLIGWLSVALVLSVRLIMGVVRTGRLIGRGVPCDEAVLADADAVADRLGINRTARILVVDGLDGPCSAGWMRLTILLPSQWMEKLAENERRVVLGHEMTHLAGRDPLWDLLARCAALLWWFHPLVWRLPQRHRLACEHVCDSVAADLIGDFATYRRRLASWALEVYGERQGMLATLTMADRSLLHRRLRWLETPLQTRPIGRSRLALISLLAVVLVAGVTTVRPVRRVLAAMPLAETPPEESVAGSDEAPATTKAALEQPPIVPPGKAAIDLNVTTPKIVRVVDEQEQPLAGARVAVGSWDDADGDSLGLGIDNPPTTNERGEVTIDVPLGAVRAHISASADGYARSGFSVSLEGDPVLRLTPGRIVKVRPLDVDGNSLPNAFALLADSRSFAPEFKENGDGVLVSPAVDLDRHWMRVVDAGDDDTPMRFSDLIDVTAPEAVDANGVITATLRPGVRLEGRLDESVPRPIENGLVELVIVEGAGHRIETEGKPPWSWDDTATVQPDGTFVFESLPPGGHVQLFALVDGYCSTNPSETELRDYFRQHDAGGSDPIDRALQRPGIWPWIYPLDRDLVQVTMPCKRTAAVDVRVVDPGGQPIEGATVHFNPNGLFLGDGLFIPGHQRFTTAAKLRSRPAEYSEWVSAAFVKAETNQDGIAHVHSLPGEGRESYRVEAEGYVMPVHPTSSANDPSRYAVVDLVIGDTQQRTITMERFVPRRQREVMVVDHAGRPLSGIKVTITEITTSSDPDRWQQWAVQRFGEVASGQSGSDGRLLLSCPMQIDGRPVPWVRVTLEGSVGNDAYVNSTVNLPTTEDGRVLSLTRSEQAPRREYALRSVSVRNVDPTELLDASPRQLLDQLVEEPNLVVLRRLLAESGFNAAEPIEFKPERNRVALQDGPAVVRINTNDGECVVVLCSVRPRGATWVDRPSLPSPPEAALVFRSDGALTTMLGGGHSANGGGENTTLTNLGGTGDHFVFTGAFEENGPFEHISRWYRIGNEEAPSLTVHHFANSTMWSNLSGDGNPPSEFGFIEYRFNGRKIEHTLPGVTNDGLMAPRQILWDGLRNEFIGPVEQSFDGKPLYRVVTNDSAEFLALEAKHDEVIVTGGRRFSNWHNWTVVVQESQTVAVRLLMVADGKQKKELLAATLAPGLHHLNMQIDPDAQTETESTVRFRGGTSQDEVTFQIPRMEIDASPSVPDQPVAVSGKAPVRLFDKKLADHEQSLVLRIEEANGKGN